MNIQYPYFPEDHSILYVEMDNSSMQEAKAYAKEHSIDKHQPTGALVVKDGKVIGRGANGSEYHKTHECERVKRGIPTGQGYELCEGCHPKNHSEPRAIADARKNGHDSRGADLYLWGHWWCCGPCWTAMIAASIKDVYLLEGNKKLFNKAHPENVIGRQFADVQ